MKRILRAGRPTHLERALLAAVAGLLALGLVGCQSLASSTPDARPAPQAGSGSASLLQQILDSGTLRVGLSGDQPPLNMTTKSGEVIGLEVDLVLSLAESMGLEASFTPMPFSELLSALERGDLDLVISGMTMTAARNARVAFAGPYFVSGKSILTKETTLMRVDETTQLDDPARTYAALAGSTSAAFVRKSMPKAKLMTTPDFHSATQMVVDGKVDALIGDYPVCAHEAARNPEAGLIALATPFTVEPLGIALPAGDPLFVNLVQNYLTTLKETGLLTRYKVKWFSGGDWMNELR